MANQLGNTGKERSRQNQGGGQRKDGNSGGGQRSGGERRDHGKFPGRR